MDEKENIMEKRSSFRGWKERNKDKIHQKRNTIVIVIVVLIFSAFIIYPYWDKTEDSSEDSPDKQQKLLSNNTTKKINASNTIENIYKDRAKTINFLRGEYSDNFICEINNNIGICPEKNIVNNSVNMRLRAGSTEKDITAKSRLIYNKDRSLESGYYTVLIKPNRIPTEMSVIYGISMTGKGNNSIFFGYNSGGKGDDKRKLRLYLIKNNVTSSFKIDGFDIIKDKYYLLEIIRDKSFTKFYVNGKLAHTEYNRVPIVPLDFRVGTRLNEPKKSLVSDFILETKYVGIYSQT